MGDGTTSVVVLAGELLREAEQLVGQKIHPATIIAGYREAAEAARGRLEGIALDHGADAEAFRADLINIAKTTLSSKILTADKDHFAQLAVDAVMRLRGSSNLDAIQIIKRVGGTLRVSLVCVGGERRRRGLLYCHWAPTGSLFPMRERACGTRLRLSERTTANSSSLTSPPPSCRSRTWTRASSWKRPSASASPSG